MAWKLQENVTLRYLGEKILFELWKCIRGFFAFSVFPTSHYTSSLPMRSSCLKTKENFPACCRMCKAPQKHRSSQVWEESFTALIISFSYFLALRFLHSPSPISLALVLTLLHLGFLLGTCSMSGLPLHFVLAPWIFSYLLLPKFSSFCDSAGHHKSSHVYSWKWIILGKKQLADRLKALSDEPKVI